MTVAVAKLYADRTCSYTEYHDDAVEGNALTPAAGGQDVAEDVLAWLDEKGFGPA